MHIESGHHSPLKRGNDRDRDIEMGAVKDRERERERDERVYISSEAKD